MRKKGLGRHAPLTAKELAEMGFCEKRIQLAHLYGEQVAPEQQLARERGQAGHQRYFEEGMASAQDRRCFVATCLFGQSSREAHALRTYRDTVMLYSRWGRCAVVFYYRIGPAACWILDRCAPLRRLAIRTVADLACRCERAVERRRAG